MDSEGELLVCEFIVCCCTACETELIVCESTGAPCSELLVCELIVVESCPSGASAFGVATESGELCFSGASAGYISAESAELYPSGAPCSEDELVVVAFRCRSSEASASASTGQE